MYPARKKNKSGKAQPELFDAAYLLKRYSLEYDLTEIPQFVKRIIIPITWYTGKFSGKYKHFKNAPEPVKRGATVRTVAPLMRPGPGDEGFTAYANFAADYLQKTIT